MEKRQVRIQAQHKLHKCENDIASLHNPAHTSQELGFPCRLPVVDIEVPLYELPLPEGVGEEHLQYKSFTVRESEEGWKERLHESASTHFRHPSQ